MERYLEGRRAIVTGGLRGLGLGIARKLHGRGARVIIWDNAEEAWNEGHHGFPIAGQQRVDVSHWPAVQTALSATLADGPVDILVNNAGINGPVRPVWDYPVDVWEKVIAIDLNGVFHGCRAVIPHMRERGYGRIVNVASIAGKEGVPYISAYAAAKAGVIAFTKSISKELARDGVLVNCIAPSMVETDLLGEMTEEHIAATKAKAPMGRLLQIEEVAAMVAWIAGPECSYTSGFAFDLSGGRAVY